MKEDLELKEELKINVDDKPIWWRKTGGGTHYFKREGERKAKPIKANQKFKARPSEIPESFRDIIIPLEKLPEEKPLPVTPPGYTPVYKGSGWWDVADGDGKIVNEKSLRKDDMEKLIESLMG